MRNVLFALVAVVALALGVVAFLDSGSAKATPAPVRQVTDVKYGVAYPVGHTFLCVDKKAGLARDWHFTDRWVKNQLSYDRYVVDNVVYDTLQIVTTDPTLPHRHVRFYKKLVNVGTGPRLEDHDYMRTLINGRQAVIQKELLFVEFNGRLEPQARPLPPCGTPRS